MARDIVLDVRLGQPKDTHRIEAEISLPRE